MTLQLGRGRRGGTSRRAAVWLMTMAVSLVCAGVGWGASAYDPATDMNSMYNTTLYTGAASWWTAGYTGQGVDVAVIDSGVSPVAGLDTPGKIVYGPDYSLESQAPNLRNFDTYGHGTFMAGLIAGHDSTLTAPYAIAAPSAYRGMAPDARIVSLKVAVADGGTDVSQMIAAINWVIEHKSDNGLNIRVINLSYGTNSAQKYEVDPLSYAAEQAWKAGIVVVAAAGNTGYQKGKDAPGLADPAYNPYVIAVGGSDSMGTPSIKDDAVGSYSASGCGGGCKDPDFVAPGSHLQGLRVPNGYIDAKNPGGAIDDRYFRGSGTSQATAIVAGAVALVLQKNPDLTPDQVKRFFTDRAKKLRDFDRKAQGEGEIRLDEMLFRRAPNKGDQKFHDSDGSGSLELSRGTDHITDDGVVLTGEQDIFGNSWSDGVSGSSWSDGVFSGSWSGARWAGNSWSGNSWSGNSWSGNSWSGNSWTGGTWSTGSWD